ncbi:MAG TPA: aspartate carbamoyltransferase catalytic subunit [Sphingomicrobium sp.]|nr:aspartate carbamoyltransferase catalytic subunit [Sphingomicrobium sp.]
MDLISIDSLSDPQITTILDEGARWFEENRRGRSHDRLAGRIVCNLFYENSTRTMMSFSVAAHRLGADVVTLPVERSSVKKGETLEDTARTLNAMRPDLLIFRHGEDGAPERIVDIMGCPLVNAGDGTNEHPTQALLDAATIRSHFGRLEGLKVAICGDIKHSRVAHSNMKLLPRLGCELRLGGPGRLMPEGIERLSVDEAIEGADLVMMLRVQRERLSEDLGDAPGEYLKRYGLTPERLARASPDAAVMHPGPINRGVEIEDSVADDPARSLIKLQVEHGIAVRMACLDLLAGKNSSA